MVEHVDIPDAQLHEPKGIASASDGDVLVADGAGSGLWMAPKHYGWETYNHGGGSQALTSGVATTLVNDGAGPQTLLTYQLPGSTGIWDVTTNQFDWAAGGCEVGDTVDIRFDFELTCNNSNDGFVTELNFAVGGITPFSLPIDDRNLDAAGSQRVMRFLSFYIGSADVLNNPTTISITADSTGDTVLVSGWYVRVHPITARYT